MADPTPAPVPAAPERKSDTPEAEPSTLLRLLKTLLRASDKQGVAVVILMALAAASWVLNQQDRQDRLQSEAQHAKHLDRLTQNLQQFADHQEEQNEALIRIELILLMKSPPEVQAAVNLMHERSKHRTAKASSAKPAPPVAEPRTAAPDAAVDQDVEHAVGQPKPGETGLLDAIRRRSALQHAQSSPAAQRVLPLK